MTRQRREAIRKAETLVSRGKLEAAVSQYEKVLRGDAGDTSTLNRLGDLYVRLKRLDEATELFRRAGEHFSREGFYVKAIAIFKKIIRLDPTRIDVYEILADLYHRQGLINEARTQYQVVADYYQQNGDTGKVVLINERMVELEPDHPTLRVRLAELYCDTGRTADAMQQYREIATFMMSHAKVEEAVRVYQGAVDLDPMDQAYLTDAVLHLKDQGYPEAAGNLLAYGVTRNPEAAGIAVLTGLAERTGAVAVPPEDDEEFGVATDEESEAEIEIEVEPEPEVESEPEPEIEPEPVSEIEAPELVSAEETAAVEAEVDEVDLEPAPAEDPAAAAPVEDEPAAVGGPVFLDLEDAGDVPYAVEREAPSDETGEIEIELDLGEIEPAPVEGAATEAQPTQTEAQPTQTEAQPTQTEAQPTQTEAQPTQTEAQPTQTEAQPTQTEAQPTQTDAPATATEPRPTKTSAPAAPPAVAELDLPVVEAPEPDPALARADELFHEARVLANYGLADKAVDLLTQVLELAPGHLDALLLGARVHADLGSSGDAALYASGAARPAAEAGRGEDWEELAGHLSELGFEVDGEVVMPPAPVAEQPAEPETPVAVEPESAPDDDRALTGSPSEAPQATQGLDWLEDPAGAEGAEGAAELFGQEDDFFDLAGELEEELRREDLLDEEFDPQPAEQSLEEIVEGFRKGVAETLAAEDYDTHYNLGIAYREMGLVDEAIGEFQLAAKDARYLVDCCSLLGSCFLEKGFPDLAVKWYERGLESPNISEKETLGLLYELGNLYVATGETDAALNTFTEIYGTNSNYRDVVARLAELGGGDG